ncbi:hypothetical protein BS333_21635 (plasmid) [Vibrio azureus]|uniref:Uncharacterized protein n=1 Tax=Vibrio azureus NBRC 104587 TaxID=1219077 RepID=U3C9U6_9VIBR|nr:hypothetical protein [Vibrio azureus]AUI88981.1 hypothetical protein BS333_21635 [Vibrio azureus]GAD78129.1 hypothetical protein VAZ01S_129_00040 [Vibrio azureus NBRC 104587]
MKKTTLWVALGTITVLATGVGGWMQMHSQPKEPSAYQEYLDLLVKVREFYKSAQYRENKEIERWSIISNIPQEPTMEPWDRVHTQPQLMFTYSKDSTLFTMNIDGTDIRKVVGREELGDRLIYPGSAERTPDGRYLKMSYFGNASTDCMVFDLKERRLLQTTDHCGYAQFSQDSKYYYFRGKAFVGVSRLELSTGKVEDLTPATLQFEKGGVTYRALHTSSFAINEALDRLTWTATRRNLDGNGYKILSHDQILYRLSDLSLIGLQDLWSPHCERGFRPGPAYRYFVCIEGKRNYVYAFSDPSTLIEEAPEGIVLQPGKWYMEAKGDYIYRIRQQGDPGMFKIMTYSYGNQDEDGDFTRYSKLKIYIPQALAARFDNIDLDALFPPIPTQAQYDESYKRQLAKLKD